MLTRRYQLNPANPDSPIIEDRELFELARQGKIAPTEMIRDCQSGEIYPATDSPAIKHIIEALIREGRMVTSKPATLLPPVVAQNHGGGRGVSKGVMWAVLISGLYLLSLAFPHPDSRDGWVPMRGNVYSGVKVYNGEGEKKSLAFEVLGGNGRYTSPSGEVLSAIKVRFPDGSDEWKDREALEDHGYCFIRTDDPALDRKEWRVYDY